MRAFELMHAELDKVWDECFRVLKSGGFLCINIGEATRTVGNEFRLYNNSSRIVSHCTGLGLVNLPNILWRKQTNAPNKFMGSGMLPCGAYVTLEHEWILIFRKGGKRMYRTDKEKSTRRQSGYFWEERNCWFSDVWDIKGTKQNIAGSGTRERNGSFPLDIPFRLINMYSQHERLDRHLEFVRRHMEEGKVMKYENTFLGCKVMTSQETGMQLHELGSIDISRSDEINIHADYTNCFHQQS